MTKLRTKLFVVFSVLVCSLCLCFGITACNNGGGHTHNFGGFWLYDGDDGHYRLATCHPEVKSGLEPHVDEDGDNVCDICGYLMHVHVDEDGDNFCDECHTEIHKHEFKNEWTFNENKHWHDATCEHFIERSDYVAHSFSGGVCKCGVKESEVKVYALYQKSPEYDLYFTQWLAWLENEGITVEYTASGDGIYHHKDGTDEVRFLGERTVKVKAQADGEPLANVWFMVAMYQTREEGYFESNGTIALGIAKTDATGIAEITFSPVGGYSSATVEYRIRLAERKDIAVFEGVREENASKPFPNRYEVNAESSEGFEYLPYEVSENSSAYDVAATIEFKYSKGWNAYNTLELPYKRYFEDLINGEGIKEEGFIYEFMSSGGNLFDYFIFSPAKYSFASSGSLEDSAKIEENAKLAAAGVYKISFTVEGDATAELYYWNEEGVNLGAFHYTNADGTPSNMYLTSQSGGTAGTGKYTGGSFVEVKIAPSYGLRLYQLGIKTDVECKVKITVERTGDYGVGADYTFNWDDSGKSELTIDLPMNQMLTFGLNGFSEGLYVLTLPDSDTGKTDIGRYYAWTDADKQKTCVWEPISYGKVKGSCKGIIRITKDTYFIYLQHTLERRKDVIITLEKYELPEVKSDEFVCVPVTPLSNENSYTMKISANGNYKITVWIANVVNGGANIPLIVYVGGKEFKLSASVYVSKDTFYTYSGSVEIGEQDTTISFRCSTDYSFTAGVTLTTVA